MQIPIYQSRVGPASGRRDTTPRREDSAYESVIQFSNALKQVGGQVAQIALDNERRVRAQTMQSEVSRAWRDYSEFKSNYHRQYFDPQNANTTDPETGLPMYVVGMRRLQEESSKFFDKAGEHFTYSEALDSFRQNYEQDMTKFSDAIRTEGRALHLGVLRHDVETNVEDAVRRQDEEQLRITLESASRNGVISPQERENIGNTSLHDMAYRRVMERLRQSIWQGAAPAGVQELMDIVNEASVQDYQDMNGEARRLTGADIENLRTLARQERQVRIQDEAWRRSEENRIADEHGQRDFRRVMRGDITSGNMRQGLTQADEALGQLDESHEYRGMNADTREKWHRALDAWDTAVATQTADQDAAASMFAVHELILQGADQHAVMWEIFRRARNGEFSEAQMRTIMNFNASRNLNDNMARFDRMTDQMGRSMGKNPAEILAAQIAIRDVLMENGRLVMTQDGQIAVAENWNPEEIAQIVQNYLTTQDWAGLRERLLGPEMAGGPFRAVFQRTNAAHEIQHIIDNNGLLGYDISNPEIAKTLSTHAGTLSRELRGALNLPEFGPGVTSYIDTDGRAILQHTQTRRNEVPITRTFTYFTDNVQLKDDGSIRSSDLVLHMLGRDGRWHHVPAGMLRELQIEIATHQPRTFNPTPEPAPRDLPRPPIDLGGGAPNPLAPRPQQPRQERAPVTDSVTPPGAIPGSDSARNLTPAQIQANQEAMDRWKQLQFSQ